MSGPTPDTPDTPQPGSATVLAALTAVTWVAAVVAVYGLLSLFTGLEVIAQRAAGPLLGPLSVAVAAAALFATLRGASRRRVGLWGCALAATAVSFAVLVVGGVAQLLLTAAPTTVWQGFLWGAFVRPFYPAAAVLGGLCGAAFWAANAYRAAGGRRPRWPWEDPFDE